MAQKKAVRGQKSNVELDNLYELLLVSEYHLTLARVNENETGAGEGGAVAADDP
jgi:hypothetical protein